MSECSCGCGGQTEIGEYIPGHDLKHTYNLVDLAGGRDRLEKLLHYTGPVNVNVICLDDKTMQKIDQIPFSDFFFAYDRIQRNVGDYPTWIITNFGEMTVEDWKAIPPTIVIPAYGHPI
jgi:hypothetical protein